MASRRKQPLPILKAGRSVVWDGGNHGLDYNRPNSFGPKGLAELDAALDAAKRALV